MSISAVIFCLMKVNSLILMFTLSSFQLLHHLCSLLGDCLSLLLWKRLIRLKKITHLTTEKKSFLLCNVSLRLSYHTKSMLLPHRFKMIIMSLPQVVLLTLMILMKKLMMLFTTRKQKIYEGGFPREFVVKASLRRITEETRFVVKRLS